MSQNQMFCYQCEQTAMGKGCTAIGVCGKTPEVANLQDLLVYKLRELSLLILKAKKADLSSEQTDVFVAEALFVTLTNVNFDPQAIVAYLRQAQRLQEDLEKKLQEKMECLKLETSIEALMAQGKQHGINAQPAVDADCLQLPRLFVG
jgi:hydroxylamine reductase